MPIPAFAIRLSIRPKRAIAVPTSRRQSSGDRTSISTADGPVGELGLDGLEAVAAGVPR